MLLKSVSTPILFFGYLLICSTVFYGCKSSQNSEGDTGEYFYNRKENRVKTDSASAKKVSLSLVTAPTKSIPTVAANFALPRTPIRLIPESPVARRMVENYYKSSNKTPGGHCLAVSKDRFIEAYSDVYGHTFYSDLPDTIATEQLDPQQVFDNLYVTATKKDAKWRSLPKKYRAKGNAGALAIAGLGELVDTQGIWNGGLRPGALVQVWRLKKDYIRVRRGTEMDNFDPYGHSFVFLDYELDEKGVIIGLRIADQGYQSYRPLVPQDYEVWWGVNLKV